MSYLTESERRVLLVALAILFTSFLVLGALLGLTVSDAAPVHHAVVTTTTQHLAPTNPSQWTGQVCYGPALGQNGPAACTGLP